MGYEALSESELPAALYPRSLTPMASAPEVVRLAVLISISYGTRSKTRGRRLLPAGGDSRGRVTAGEKYANLSFTAREVLLVWRYLLLLIPLAPTLAVKTDTVVYPLPLRVPPPTAVPHSVLLHPLQHLPLSLVPPGPFIALPNKMVCPVLCAGVFVAKLRVWHFCRV